LRYAGDFVAKNPLSWEGWKPQNAMNIVDASGQHVRISYEVESVVNDIVTFTETTCDVAGTPLRVDRASLRFLDVNTLAGFVSDTGFEIETRYGGWFGEALTETSPEIITIARLHS
jgi:hypothetical protein